MNERMHGRKSDFPVYQYLCISFLNIFKFDQNWWRRGLSLFISGVSDLAYRKRNA
jgi:hypothetical protein